MRRRCSAEMEWRHATWQCPRCKWKLGCCEGEPQTACDQPAVSLAGWQPSIEVHELRRTYRRTRASFGAGARGRGGARDLVRGRPGRAVRAARPERRREDDDDQDADHAPAADERRGARARARRRRATPARCASGSATSSAATAGSTSGSRPTTTSATSPSSTASPGAGQRERIDEVLELVGLDGPRAGAGRGLLARHAPAAAHRPRDHPRPRGGLPRRADDRRRSRRRARRCARRSPGSSQSGKTVLLTTHYMFEADTLCDRMAVIAKGRIVASGHAARAEAPTSSTGRVHRGRGVRRSTT